tara:strand:- start:92 stop:598 length:507 start_codon:yes stop_codon:yes gene_type:complete
MKKFFFNNINEKVNKNFYRTALSQFATGITIITNLGDDKKFFGMTINSFNSVSLNPPLILWSLGNLSRSLPSFKKNSYYVVNVLSSSQQHIADIFSSNKENQFDGIDFELSETGLPIILGCSAWFECHNKSAYPEGDHVIFVGEVKSFSYESKPSLIFHQSEYKLSDK